MQEQKEKESSANYLMIDVLENCGLPLPAYQSALKEFREEFPVVSAMQIADENGEWAVPEEVGGKLNQYRSLQYYLLFDYDNESF